MKNRLFARLLIVACLCALMLTSAWAIVWPVQEAGAYSSVQSDNDPVVTYEPGDPTPNPLAEAEQSGKLLRMELAWDWDDTYSATYAYTYDSAGRVTKKQYSSDSGTVETKTYTYNAAGKIKTETLDLADWIDSHATANYSYDGSGRLTKVVVQGNGGILNDYEDYEYTFSYTYTAGRLTKCERFGDYYDDTTTCTYDSNGQLISNGEVTYSYDSAGRLQEKVADQYTYTYSYDAAGKLIKEVATTRWGDSTATTRTYTYDGSGRLKKVVDLDVEQNVSNTFTLYYAGDTADGWVKTASGYCYYQNGAKVTGWKQISNKWYYFTSDGIMKTGWLKSGSSWYYLKSSGEMAKGWLRIGSTYYYFDNSGVMKTGWQQIAKKWYYLGSDGAMKTGWQQIAKKWYYLGSDGAMRTGWQQISKKWYYFNSAGDMKTGWLKSGSSWYYLKSSGVMAASESVKIGTKTYNFNSSGVCTNP